MTKETDTTDTNEPFFVKSRMEHGRFVNSFNPEFRMPSFLTVLCWVFRAPNNTRLPANRTELDTTLPVTRPKKDEIWRNPPGVRFIWIGHATCLVQMNDFMFITDPIFSQRCGILPMIGPKRYRPPALDVDDLPDQLEAVLISHNHYDHLDTPSVRRLNERFGNRLTWFCGRAGRQWFLDSGIENVVELDWWGQGTVPKKNVQITFCPSQHWSRRSVFDANKILWGGYVVHYGQYKFYFAGDTGYTDNISIFKDIGNKYGPFDLSAIPIGAYEPRWIMERQHVSPVEAVQIHRDIKSKKSIGIHWGTWALANEFYLEPKTMLDKVVKDDQSLSPDSFIVIGHGEIFDLPENN